MNKCLVCDSNIQHTFYNIFCNQNALCYKCYQKFEQRNETFNIKKFKGKILYYYNDFFRDLLFKYKGMGDYVLKDIFLFGKSEWIKNKYKGYSIVLAPSNEDIEKKRGFCHLEGIFCNLNMKIIKCFKKKEKWKQSDKNLEERRKIQNVIKIDKSMLKGVKKVLIVDDVLTSGSTIRVMVSQMPTDIDIKMLILASNCKILANEIV